MSLHNFQSEDLFIIPHSKNTYILYAPLRRALMKINPALVIALQKYLKSDSENLTEHETDMLTQLSEASMFQGKSRKLPFTPKGWTSLLMK